MLDLIFRVLSGIWGIARLLVYPVLAILALFLLLCCFWSAKFALVDKRRVPPSGQVRERRIPFLKQLLVLVPRRYVLDRFSREEGYFYPKGIHMFCGGQGSGKTIACVEMMQRLQRRYPKCRVISNFGLATEDDCLTDWHQLLDYTNGHKGVIVGIDEIQNWFMSGVNKLPPEMLEVATQNRKNNRILCCTAQVFTRVNKGLREQVSLVYNPHTFLGCFTVVVRRRPEFDDEGNVTRMKYAGMYSFVHTDGLRDAYDTYKVIHTLSREGFREPAQVLQTVNYFADGGRGRKKA